MSARLRLRDLLAEAEVRPARIVLSVALGTMALGSAVGLAAVAAWLIARAAQMPSPADLALAAVTVRFFGIARGLFRYLERLASHETALAGVVALRTRTYDRVAGSDAARVLGLRRGDIVARMGADIDAMGDAVVRSIIPLGVAATVSLISIGVVGVLLPWAGLALALALAGAAVSSGLLTWRSARLAAESGTLAAAAVATTTLDAIDGATEHRVWGTHGEAAARVRIANREAEAAAELAAKPAAWAAASLQAAQGLALVACLVLAVLAAREGRLEPTWAAVVALLPLSAFEAVSAVPGAAMQAFRSAAAARRVLAITPEAPSDGAGMDQAPVAAPDATPTAPAPKATKAPTLELSGLSAAWPGMTPTPPVTATVPAGGALGIVGRSGIGKTTLLLTMAGALAPAAGGAAVGGDAVGAGTLGGAMAMTPEDAHLFGTTVLENLRVARGDLSEAEALDALTAVGLGQWLAAQPEGLATLVGPGGHTVSGGERRRLLLARSLVNACPIQLIDEPAEHLDADGIDALRSLVAAMRAQRRSVVIVTHDLGILDLVDEVVSLDDR